MKRLLIVLFGVLVFQGSVWALPSGGDLCQQNGDGGKARVLSPADTQQLNKGSAILLQWKDSEDWLGNKVTIELHSRKGKTEQVVKTWPLQINTGSALITRADLRGAKIKKASKKDIRYVFRLKNHAKAKRFIDSGCFTFTKSEKSQRQRRNLKEEIEGLESTLTQALADISDLTDRLETLEGGDGDSISGEGQQDEPYRAEVAAMVALADIVKKKVGIFYSTKGSWPEVADAAEVGLDVVTGSLGAESEGGGKRFISRWFVEGKVNVGLIGVEEYYGAKVDVYTEVMTYEPTASAATITWSCTWHGESDYPGAKPDGCEDR